MAGGHRFGTFGGVFTPSVLTILGVIMYLRLPRVVGEAGLWMAIGIILVAHVISVTTGLSVASIATDKKVQAGGPYYIVSRSLGLPLGGTLGLALFVGLAFSISLYVIGFSESILDTLEIERTKDAIRICGSITLAVLAIITLISTALAIKAQYVILTAIILSLVSIFFGSPPHPAVETHTSPVEGASLPVLFGIFFPAVTGFTAGVNMSGDLKDPKRAIPRGTILSIATGLLVYLGLTIYLAVRVPADELVNNDAILLDLSFWSPLVLAGIWGATLSSALGSILGAPRILQALSLDRITPRVFAHGHGRHNEPRNALILALLIGEAGILIGSLDVIAAIVSMFFIATYGFLNISAAVEAWASPDFRPEFRIPKTVSVTGAVTCVLVMIQLDFLAMIGSTALLAGLFLYLKRRELTLESGDTWVGVWTSVVRAGLQRLRGGFLHSRNWRPNVLMFAPRHVDEVKEDDVPPTPDDDPLLAFGESVISRGGLLTRFELVEGDRRKSRRRSPVPASAEDPPTVGIFHRRVPADDPWDAAADVCRYHGFSGVEPNAVLLDWYRHSEDSARFAGLLDELGELDLSLLVLAHDPEVGWGEQDRIDVWWTPERGNVLLSIALLRFVTVSDQWRRARMRFLLIGRDAGETDTYHKTMRRLLDEARVEAEVKVIHNALEERTLEQWVRQESSDAGLVVLGLRDRIDYEGDPEAAERYFQTVDTLASDVGSVLLVRGSSMFGEVFGTSAAARAAAAEVDEGAAGELPALSLPRDAALADEVRRASEAADRAVATFAERGVAAVYATHSDLVERIGQELRRALDQLALDEPLDARGRARYRKLLGRAQSGLLFQAQRHINAAIEEELPDLERVLEARIEALLESLDLAVTSAPEQRLVSRERSEMAPGPDDSPSLRRFKWRRRFGSKLLRRPPRLKVEVRRLLKHTVDDRIHAAALEQLGEAAGHAYYLALELSRLLGAAKATLKTLRRHLDDEGVTPEMVEAERERLIGRLEELAEGVTAHGEQTQRAVRLATRHAMQDFGRDIGRLDVRRHIRRERKLSKEAVAQRTQLLEAPATFERNQDHLLHRAGLVVLVASFQHRLATIVGKHQAAGSQAIRGSLLKDYERVVGQLEELKATVEAGDLRTVRLSQELRPTFDPGQRLDELARELQSATRELPESYPTLTEESVQLLVEERFEEGEISAVPVRRVVEFLLDAEFTGSLRPVLSAVPTTEQRAVTVARDVLRLVSFHLSDWDLTAEDLDVEGFQEQMAPVLENGLARMRAEHERLSELGPDLEARMHDQLELVFDRTDAFAATGSIDPLKKYLRGGDRQRVLSRFEIATARVKSALRDTVVALLYKANAGIEFVRGDDDGEGEEAVVDHVLELVNRCAPDPKVLDALPFFYHQLFLGKTAIDKAFFVGRKAELDRARRAIDNYRRGRQGALVVTGDPSSGKSAVCQRVAASHFQRDRVFHVSPPRGGSIDPEVFRKHLAGELDMVGSASEMLAGIPEGSVIVLHDLEMWFERSAEGLAVLEVVEDLVARYSGRCLFVLNMSSPAFDAIRRLRPLADMALGVVRCGPMAARELKEIIELRHRSTGLRFELNGRPEDQLADWRVARLYTAIHRYSGGLVGAALHGWAGHVEGVDGETLSLSRPRRLNVDALDELRMPLMALLIELVVHKQVTFERMQRLTQEPEGRLSDNLATLKRMGLVHEDSQGIIELDRFVQHLVVRHLRERGLVL